MLCVTNLLLHNIDTPRVCHDNSLLKDVLDYTDDDCFDVILMNPHYGGSEKTEIKNYFPSDPASSETADLFMSVIMYRLKQNGRAAVILPDGFLFGTDNANYRTFSKVQIALLLKMKRYPQMFLQGIILIQDKGSVKAPEFSHTDERIYAIVQDGKLKHLKYYDAEHKQHISVDLLHPHKGVQPHIHIDLNHNPTSPGIAPTAEKKTLIEKIKKEFHLL